VTVVDAQQRVAAVAALRELGAGAPGLADGLVGLVDDASPQVQQMAWRVLAEVDLDRMIAEASRRLGNTALSPMARHVAAEALATAGEAGATALIESWATADRDQRRYSGEAARAMVAYPIAVRDVLLANPANCAGQGPLCAELARVTAAFDPAWASQFSQQGSLQAMVVAEQNVRMGRGPIEAWVATASNPAVSELDVLGSFDELAAAGVGDEAIPIALRLAAAELPENAGWWVARWLLLRGPRLPSGASVTLVSAAERATSGQVVVAYAGAALAAGAETLPDALMARLREAAAQTDESARVAAGVLLAAGDRTAAEARAASDTLLAALLLPDNAAFVAAWDQVDASAALRLDMALVRAGGELESLLVARQAMGDPDGGALELAARGRATAPERAAWAAVAASPRMSSTAAAWLVANGQRAAVEAALPAGLQSTNGSEVIGAIRLAMATDIPLPREELLSRIAARTQGGISGALEPTSLRFEAARALVRTGAVSIDEALALRREIQPGKAGFAAAGWLLLHAAESVCSPSPPDVAGAPLAP